MIDNKEKSLKIGWVGKAFLMRSYLNIEMSWEEYSLKRSSMYNGPIAGKVSAYKSREVRVLWCREWS